jgi:hypothetical protein
MTREPASSEWDLYMDTEPAEEASSSSVKKTPRVPIPRAALQPVLPDTEPEPAAHSSQAYLRLKLENLLLSPKTRKALTVQGVGTLRQLCRLSPTRLAGIPGIGTHNVSEIGETLDYYGLSLSPEPPVRPSKKKRTPTDQLCLPGMELSEIARVCRVCGQALPAEPASERYCSPACRPSARPRKLGQAANPSTLLPQQLTFSHLTQETA